MPRFAPEMFTNDVLSRNGQLGRDACEVMAAALNAVDPYPCVNSHLSLKGNVLEIGGEGLALEQFDRIFLVGIGKASVPMVLAVLDQLGARITQAMAITKDAKFMAQDGYAGKLTVLQGAHPVPDERSVRATQKVLEQIPALTARDLILMAISGGGSALFTAPLAGLSLSDLQTVTTLLLRSGADIQEINTVRKHLDLVKGGRLAALWAPAQIQTLILSDVIGDDLDMIASGPTVADPTTFSDAWQIVQKYDLEKAIPESIARVLRLGLEGDIPESVKPARMADLKVKNHLIGTNQLAAEAAAQRAKELGYTPKVLTTTLTGLTAEVSSDLLAVIDEELKLKGKGKPVCLILGGETTVAVTGTGKGGRNQDLALRMTPGLEGKAGVLLISLATDGEDGPTDAAGAASDANVLRDGDVRWGMEIDTYIKNNNAYVYLEKTGALVRTGATGTNVNDLIFIFIS